MAYCNEPNLSSFAKNVGFAKSTHTRPEFRKSQEAIRIPVINEIYKFPPHSYPFDQENYLCKLSWDYLNYPTQKWYIWTSFQTSRKRFRKLQEAILLTVINEIFKFLPHLHPSDQEDNL